MSAPRPSRRMPTMAALLAHHGMADNPSCWKCQLPLAADRLERAHVIDRHCGGLDNVENLRPLCSTCHRLQPSFAPGDEVAALEWFDHHESPVVAITLGVLGEYAKRHGCTVDEVSKWAMSGTKLDYPEWAAGSAALVDSAVAQGFPRTIDDPAVLRRFGALLGRVESERAA